MLTVDGRQAHVPVLADRVVALLADTPPGPVVDATVGAGGHARALLDVRLRRGGAARLVGIDRDPTALALARDRLADLGPDARYDLVHAGFDALGGVLDDLGHDRVSAVLFDLGASSMHLDEPGRGFSYRRDGPLDMRMDPTAPVTAADVVNGYDERDLAQVIARYGEERFARRIAAAVVAARPLTSTAALAEVVRGAIPAATRRTGPHPATRTFQALRIEVNGELEALAAALPVAIERLGPGGVCAVIAYHSLEDRIVKRAFQDAATGCVCPPDLPACACGRLPLVSHVVRRPERPDPAEVAANRRASSARLRAVRRLSTDAKESA